MNTKTKIITAGFVSICITLGAAVTIVDLDDIPAPQKSPVAAQPAAETTQAPQEVASATSFTSLDEPALSAQPASELAKPRHHSRIFGNSIKHQVWAESGEPKAFEAVDLAEPVDGTSAFEASEQIVFTETPASQAVAAVKDYPLGAITTDAVDVEVSNSNDTVRIDVSAQEVRDVAIASDELDVTFGSVDAEDTVAVVEEGEVEVDEAEAFLASDDVVTVNFPQEDIRVILRSVADLYGLNLIVPDALVGQTSIKLRDVTWPRIFNAVLRPVGYTYVDDGSVVEVISQELLNQEPQEVRNFPIKYAKASDVAETLGDIVTGSIRVDNRSNSLVIKDRPSILSQVEKILEESTIDKPTLQVMIATKFIEVLETTGKSAGSEDDNSGLDWWSGAAPFGGSDFLSWGVNAGLDILDNFGAPGTSRFKTAVFSDKQYNLALRLLKTHSDANLVANPTVVVLNNETTNLLVGRNQPIIEANFDEDTGNFTVGEVDYLPIGVQLEVTPRVNAGADQISLDVKPKVSRIVGEVEFRAQGSSETDDGANTGAVISYPIEAVRETQTQVNIKNGYTLAIGGLSQFDDTEVIRKVPVLGDLPYIGRLFQQRSDDKKKIDLIMFLTASILNPDGSTYKEVIDPRMIERMGIASSDIPGYESTIEVPNLDRMTESERQQLAAIERMRDQIVRRSNMDQVRDNLGSREVPQTVRGPWLDGAPLNRPFNQQLFENSRTTKPAQCVTKHHHRHKHRSRGRF